MSYDSFNEFDDPFPLSKKDIFNTSHDTARTYWEILGGLSVDSLTEQELQGYVAGFDICCGLGSIATILFSGTTLEIHRNDFPCSPRIEKRLSQMVDTIAEFISTIEIDADASYLDCHIDYVFSGPTEHPFVCCTDYVREGLAFTIKDTATFAHDHQYQCTPPALCFNVSSSVLMSIVERWLLSRCHKERELMNERYQFEVVTTTIAVSTRRYSTQCNSAAPFRGLYLLLVQEGKLRQNQNDVFLSLFFKGFPCEEVCWLGTVATLTAFVSFMVEQRLISESKYWAVTSERFIKKTGGRFTETALSAQNSKPITENTKEFVTKVDKSFRSLKDQGRI